VLNSSPVCSNGVCDLVCNQDFHDCSAQGAELPNCVRKDSPSACGSSCTLCSVPANGRATCADYTTCGVACDTDYHPCGTDCVADNSTSLESCGKTCDECPQPTALNTVATCSGTDPKCGFACDDSSYHLCLDPLSPNKPSCPRNEDASHCLLVAGGTTCGVCDGDQVCLDGVCSTPDAGS
jgi:hypothetical protein